MSFDEIPENEREGYPCECGGSITLHNKMWKCDSCIFEKTDLKEKDKEDKRCQ